MKTKAITEGALLCALTVLLSLLCYYVPLMIILYIFIPVPMVVLAKRQDMRTTVVSSLAASAILFFHRYDVGPDLCILSDHRGMRLRLLL